MEPASNLRPSVQPGAAIARIKGVALHGFFKWYAVEHGARLRSILADLPPSLRAHLDMKRSQYGVMPNTWYPAPLVHGIVDGIVEGMDEAEREQLAADGAREIMAATLSGIHRVMIRMLMTPERYAKFAQLLWDRYYSCGLIDKTVQSPTHHVTTVCNWNGHHPFICKLNTYAPIAIYEQLGAQNPRVELLRCVSRGDDHCALSIEWDES